MLASVRPMNSNEFNRLLDVEDISNIVKETSLVDKAYELFPNLFCEHGLEPYWGISLLHRHWSIEVGEHPVEYIKDNRSEIEYVTCPKSVSIQNAKIAPKTIAIDTQSDGGLKVVEYSCDPFVVTALELLMHSDSFLKEFSNIMWKNGLSDTFALSVIRNPNCDKNIFLEYSYLNRVSIVKERSKQSLNSSQTIETAWSFEQIAPSQHCIKRCYSYCNIQVGHPRFHTYRHAW